MERVSLLKTSSYEDLAAKLDKLLEPLGGWEAYCKPGDKVLLKPNLVMARPVATAANTHPALILAVAKLLREMGCRVAVGDSPGIGSAQGVLRQLGLLEELEACGAEVAELATPGPVTRGSEGVSGRFKDLRLAKELNGFDRIINLPKLKSHGQMGITLATKNLFGCVAGPAKGQWHYTVGRDYTSFAGLLVEIAFTVRADLHILDGIVGMDGNGPTHGRPRKLNLLIAGTNPIAVDRVAVAALQLNPAQFPIFTAADSLGIPGVEMAEIELAGDPLSSCLVDDFQIPALSGLELFFQGHSVLNRMVASLIRRRLVLDPQICIDCRKCEKHCPAKAIRFRKPGLAGRLIWHLDPERARMHIDPQICIRCCCCQELCPVGALSIRDPLVLKLVQRVINRGGKTTSPQ